MNIVYRPTQEMKVKMINKLGIGYCNETETECTSIDVKILTSNSKRFQSSSCKHQAK